MSTTTLQQDTKLLVPKLRFKEFSGEWKIQRLQKISKIERGRFSPRPRNNPVYYHGKIPFVQTSDIVNSNGKVDTYTQTLNNLGLSVSKLFPKETILITIAANIGYSGVLQFDMACPDSLIGILPSNNVDNYYLNYFLSTQQKKMDYLAPEGAQKNINIEFLNPYKIPTTTLPEQQKIASFLSAVDEKIQQLQQKVLLLEQYKKGVMQQLFSGQLRFKDENGNDYPDWEEKKLGDLSRKKSSNIAANKIETDFGDYIIYGASGILKKVSFYKELNDYISIVKDGAGVGRLFYCKGKSSVLGTMEMIIPNDNVNTYYLYFLLSNIDFSKYITGSTIPHIYYKDYSYERCNLPSLHEQQKIAVFLSGIDSKLTSTNQQLNQLQQFKKGLLQQLFV